MRRESYNLSWLGYIRCQKVIKMTLDAIAKNKGLHSVNLTRQDRQVSASYYGEGIYGCA